MRQLLLAGGGDPEQSFLIDKLFIKLLGKKRVLYIPIAFSKKENDYASCRQWFNITYTTLRIKFDVWTNLKGKKLKDYTEEENRKEGNS